MPRSPNIILCQCDQLRAFEVGCYGNPVIRTPHIDRLAHEGVRFETAVSNNPVCMPARSCLLSGQYSRTCMGSVCNRVEKDANGREFMPEYPVQERTQFPSPTLAEELKQLGYATGLIGKWHIHPAPKLLGFDHAVYPRVHHRHTGQHFIDNDGAEFLVEGFSVDFEANLVTRFIREHRAKPFFLYYNISPPHMPLLDAPEKYRTMYAPGEVPLRPNVFVDGRIAHDEHWFRVYLWDFLAYQENLPHTRTLPPGFDLRHLTALYYGMTTWVDDTVGKMMAALEASGLRDDTIVVFLSDHGDNLGSHRKFNKGDLIEESIRIPLFFHAPGRLPSRANQTHVAQTIDVMPTLLDLCGAAIPNGMQGRSLAPIVTGHCEALAENAAFIETPSGEIGMRTPTHLLGIKLGPEMRTLRAEPICFFDLQSDPFEQRNLVGTNERAATRDSLQRTLRAWNASTPWLV